MSGIASDLDEVVLVGVCDRAPDGPEALEPVVLGVSTSLHHVRYHAIGRHDRLRALVDDVDEPNDALATTIANGGLREAIETLRTRSGLAIEVPAFETDDDPETLRARYNALFEVGNPEPPISPYESNYREEVSWNDVNLDLARAYDYFGLDVDRERREHHDHLRLLLEFAAFLARLEAVGEDSGRRARTTFLERHLRVLVDGLREAIDEEPGTGVYGDAIALLDRLVVADHRDLEGAE